MCFRIFQSGLFGFGITRVACVSDIDLRRERACPIATLCYLLIANWNICVIYERKCGIPRYECSRMVDKSLYDQVMNPLTAV